VALKGILKWPLIITAIVVVLRVISERAGAPVIVSNLLSVVALHTLIVPIYVAVRLATGEVERPYLSLFKLILIYVLAARALILPTYWLARIFRWSDNRFGGLADSTPFIGFIAIPFLTAAFWIVTSLVVGGAIGSLILTIMGPRSRAARPAKP
jgi:hypothetical protein